MRRRSIFSIETYAGSTKNGRYWYVSPVTTASGVSRTLKFSGTIPRVSRMIDRNGPSLPRMIFQLIVRIRKLVKNGAMTRNSRTAL